MNEKEANTLLDRLASCIIGFGVGIGTRLLSQDYNYTQHIIGFSLAGVCGTLIPLIKNKGRDEHYIVFGSSMGCYPAGFVVTDYVLKTFQ